MPPQDIENLVERLCKLGEDKDELSLWASIYKDLEPEEQQELVVNLQDELQKLEKIERANRN